MNALPEDLSRPLTRFGIELGDAAPDWIASEELTRIKFYDEDFPTTALSQLNPATILALTEAYNTAVDLKFLLGDLPLLNLQDGVNETDFEEFLEEAQKSPTVKLDFVLDKRVLIQNLLGDFPQNCHPILYLFPERLIQFLNTADLKNLEASFWPERPDVKVIIFISDRDVWANGSLLAVVGGQHLNQWQSILSEATINVDRLSAIYEDSRQALRWDERWLQYLTPLHLCVKGDQVFDDPFTRALWAHLANIALLYTAERTVQHNDRFISRYATTRGVIDVRHMRPDEVASETRLAVGAQALLEIFNWAYEPPWSLGERLPLVQISIVNALRATDPPNRYHMLLENGPNILADLQWNWEEILDGKVNAYISQVQQLESYVSDAVTAYGEQVAQLVKGVSETMLAAVGVTLASFVAALFKDEFNATVFRIGLLAYAGYVFFFPLLYNMLNQFGRYRTLEQNFRYRRQRFERRLFPKRVEKIIGEEVKDSRHRFWRWFWATVVVYVLVIAGASIAAFIVPPLFSTTASTPATP